MLIVGSCKRRMPSTRWSAKEFAAFKACGFDVMTPEDFTEQVVPVVEYYAADLDLLRAFWGTKGDRVDADFRRRDLLTLLHNWAGELDKARAWESFVAKKMDERGSGRL